MSFTTRTGRLLAAGLLLGTMGVLLIPAMAPCQTPRPSPLRFESEVVRLDVAPDSLTVDGFYVMSCDPEQTGYASLFYPYPADSLLGGAHSMGLFVRTRPDTIWRPAECRELPRNLGAHWRLPLAPGDTIEVRTRYRQALYSQYARYIVTTVKGWEHPLHKARFEITLPPETEPTGFSFPFTPCGKDGRPMWCYEAVDFRPDHDVGVWWRVSSVIGDGGQRQ